MKTTPYLHVIIAFLLFLLAQFSLAQTATQDSLQTIETIGVFDGKVVSVGNFAVEKVYRINDYCIALTDLSQSQADSLAGRKIMVSGKLKIVVGRTFPAKTSTDGTIYEPYKEPDKIFIIEPVFTILN